jgi:hypothetical protein
MKPTVSHHPSELLLGYLEDTLAREEKSRVERHLEECAECAEELEEIRLLADGLRTHGDRVFCPDATDLSGFFRSGEDPRGEIAEHLERCEACREDLDILRASEREEFASPAVREAFKRLSEGRAEAAPAREPFLKSILKRLSVPFGPSVAALAAAAVLLVIMIYPGSEVEPMIGLSSVRWERTLPAGNAKTLIESPRVAVVLAFSDFRSPVRQETIDSLYRELKPTQAMKPRFEFINPAAVRSALSKRESDLRDPRKWMIRLSRALDADLVLILTVEREKGLRGLKGRIADGRSGRLLGSESLQGIEEKDLSSQLKKTMIDLLNRYGPRDRG